MKIRQSRATCVRCSKPFGRLAMRKDVQVCQLPVPSPPGSRRQAAALVPGRHVEVRAFEPYWLQVADDDDAPLAELDRFLRGIWLECCGHLSEFTIDGVRYTSFVEEPSPFRRDRSRSMRTVTGAVLRDGLDFRHVYDFGSSTLLKLTVLGPLPVPVPSRSVVLLARNDPPDWRCRECGGQAKWLCAECADEEAVFLCGACGRKHRCDQEMLRPVKNSPRMGVCGY